MYHFVIKENSKTTIENKELYIGLAKKFIRVFP